MASKAQTDSFRLIARVFGEGVVTGLTDAELVDRFATTRDAEAFATIVARHGPMVMARCQGLLGCRGEADDAFQATFLVLMKRAATFPVGTSLGGWLYSVVRRVARQARIADTRRRRRELTAGSRSETRLECLGERSEIIRIIRQEIDRLPERYRSPIVLCDLEGLTRDEAASLLGCPAGTVGGRLARARQQLRDRLERRGLAPSVAFPILSEIVTPAATWRASLEAAIQRASSLSTGSSSTPVALSLASTVSRGFAVASVNAVIFAALAVIATFGLVAARDTPEPQTVPAASQTPATKPAAIPDADDPKLAGHFVGRVIGPDGRPVSGARIFIAPYAPLPTEAGPIRATSGGDGRFEFDASDMTYTELDGLPARRQGLLIATADGYEPDWVVTWGQTRGGFRSHWDPVKGADLTLQLARDDVPIYGRLLNHDGQPLAGARVRVTALQVPWKRDLDAHLQKFKGANFRFVNFDYERSLYRPAVLPGVETDITTGADGRFRVSGLGRDRLADLVVTAPTVVETRVTVMTREAADVVFDQASPGNVARAILGARFTLRLLPGRTVSGTVRDRDTHQPISGAWVGQDVLNKVKHEYAYKPVTSDSNGRFTISGIDPANSRLELTAVPQPGQPYAPAKVEVGMQSDVTIECVQGIPFRLKLVDGAGVPVDADVEYRAVIPNSHVAGFLRSTFDSGGWPISRVAKASQGNYEGFVIPGPGAVLVTTAGRHDYRPAHVDPKSFFAPGKTDWTIQELISEYGTHDTLIVGPGGSWIDQHDYSAIVLVNPTLGSKPLELSATVYVDKPRMATFLGPDGKPVVGVQTQGLTSFPWDHEPPLRASTIPIRKLLPDRGRRITFQKQDRELIGFLLARADGEAPYVVQLQPWATLTGRILNEHGLPFSGDDPSTKAGRPSVALSADRRSTVANHDDPQAGDLPDSGLDGKGRFTIERLIPGQRYSALIYREGGQLAGTAFENVVLKPGEVRDLGDIPSKAPVQVRDK